MSAGRPGISRRESLRRAGLMGLGAGLPFSFTACAEESPSPWTTHPLEPVHASGYGTDPDLLHPAPAPWPNTLTEPQLDTLSVLVDILIPAEGDLPAASAVGVVQVIDEWISAPYPTQQQDRTLLLSGFDWCDREAQRRFNSDFRALYAADCLAIIDDIAHSGHPGDQALEGPRGFFGRLRQLTAGAYYTSPEGVRELGYVGNVPIPGDWPGPTEEALAHLEAALERLGLSL